MNNLGLVTRNDVDNAYQLLKSAVTHTPLQYDRYLSEKYQATILLKREDLQKVRSFKLRGAYYAIMQRPKEELGKWGCLRKCRQPCTRGGIYLS